MKWQKGAYSPGDFAAMQKDAVARVQEMQRRADEKLRQSNAVLPAPPPPPKTPPLPPPLPPTPSPVPNNDNGKLQQLLSVAGIDNDRLLILGLLLLLYNEGSDQTLLLALLYLFL